MIEEHRLERNLKEFSFPRLSGTIHEKKAFNHIKERILSLNLSPSVQSFEFSTFYSRVYPKIMFVLLFLINFFFFLDIRNSIVTVIIIAMFIVLGLLILITRYPEKIKFGKVLPSHNLWAEIPQMSDSAKVNVYFTCHIDSKSQILPIRIRTLSNVSWTFSYIAWVTILIIDLFVDNIIILILGFIFLICNLIPTVLLAINFTQNKSPGSIDNGSGIVLVLELLHYYALPENQLNNINLSFIFFGAEECGTMGVRNFYKTLDKEKKDSIIVNNFESLAQNVVVFISKELMQKGHRYYEMFKRRAQKENFRLFPSSFTLTFHTDGVYLMQQGIDVLEFESSDTGKFMHTTKDTPDKVNPSILKTVCQVLIESLNDLDAKI